jgi:hypothetical protein
MQRRASRSLDEHGLTADLDTPEQIRLGTQVSRFVTVHRRKPADCFGIDWPNPANRIARPREQADIDAARRGGQRCNLAERCGAFCRCDAVICSATA